MRCKKELISRLSELLHDERGIERGLYSAGPYWRGKGRKIVNQLKRKGLAGFRGYDSGVGTSYCDNVIADVRNEADRGWKKLLYAFSYISPLNKFFNASARLIINHHSNLLSYQTWTFKDSKRIKELLDHYTLDNTTAFGCVEKIHLFGKEYSTHYLESLNKIDIIAQSINFNNVTSALEIGGGFGCDIHILLQNYKDIKKVIYLDMVPNLLVGTEYLKSFYGRAVFDYRSLKKRAKIQFSENGELEIYCIAPWQIEKLECKVDYFHNTNSFVEMAKEAVKNYAKHIKRLLGDRGSIALVSYDGFDINTTFDPKVLNEYFDNTLLVEEHQSLFRPNRKDIYLIKGQPVCMRT